MHIKASIASWAGNKRKYTDQWKQDIEWAGWCPVMNLEREPTRNACNPCCNCCDYGYIYQPKVWMNQPGNQGIGYRPIVNVQKSLITYAKTDPQQYRMYTDNIEAFLDSYRVMSTKDDKEFAKCTDGDKVPDDIQKVCKFDLSKLGECNSDTKFGYPAGTPCILLKLNKIYGWLPDTKDLSETKNILVNCTGQNPADVENIGELAYYPGVEVDGKKYGYFENSYFPFVGQPGYSGPLVALQFKKPVEKVIILVECQLQNLKNSFDFRMNFEIEVK